MFNNPTSIPTNTTRIKSLNIKGLPSMKIKPWSNRDVILFTQEFEDYKISDDITFDTTMNLQYKYLIQPNIVECKTQDFSLIQKQILLVELYKISRSNNVEISYICSKEGCEHNNVDYFKLNNNVQIQELIQKSFKANSYKFTYTSNNLYVYKEEFSSSLNYANFLLSYVDEIYYNEAFVKMEKEDIPTYILDEIDEFTFNLLVRNIEESMPFIKFSQTCICEKCDAENKFEYKGIPDFSIAIFQ